MKRRPVRFALELADGGALETCGGALALANDVESRVGRDVFADDADITFALTFEGSGAERRARIVQRGRDGSDLGERIVPAPEGDGCEKTRDTIAVVLAILVGPLREVEVIEEPPPPPPAPPPPRRPTPRAKPPPPAETATPPWTLTPSAEVVFGTGILPGFGWGVQGSFGAKLPGTLRLSIVARAYYWPDRTTGTRPTSEVDRLGGALLACRDVLTTERFGLNGCLGADGARLHARSSDLTRGSETGYLVDVLAEATLGYRLVRTKTLLVEPRVSAQIAALVRRDRFLYRDYTGQSRILLEPAPAAFQGSVGVAVHFF